jgi:two-component system OmpR family response regulator
MLHGDGLRCLVIEDEVEMSGYICAGLLEHGFATTACGNGIDGLALALNETWDLVILDRMLPGGIDGLSILDKMRLQGQRTPVIVVSALSHVDERVRGLRGGAPHHGFHAREQFGQRKRLRQIIVGAADSGQPVQLRVADLVLDTSTMRVARGGKTIPLQPREYRLLEFLLRHEGQVVTRTMLLEAVWDYSFDPQTNVIDVQISRLRAKIDKDFSVPLIHTMRGSGYLLSDRTAADA